MNSDPLAHDLKQAARDLGFGRVGICPAVTSPGFSQMLEWLEAGYAGEMRYLAARQAAYEHPRSVLDGVRSLVLLAFDYRTAEPTSVASGEGRISRYAWGIDYHELIWERLDRLAAWLQERVPSAKTRGVVDTAPLMEREFAELAGLGWIGKNTLLINTQAGSWFFLAALLTDVELPADTPHATDHCGTCRACLDACPTDAFVDAWVLDARKCISYLTIELREPIPIELRPQMGNWVFGCDVCQDVCPWNRRSPEATEQGLAPLDDTNPLALVPLFELDEEGFRQRFRHTPLWRAKRRGILRNAAIVLGNQRDPAALAALTRGLNDDESLVRGAAAWALGQIGTPAARQALKARHSIETDSQVSAEIAAAFAIEAQVFR